MVSECDADFVVGFVNDVLGAIDLDAHRQRLDPHLGVEVRQMFWFRSHPFDECVEAAQLGVSASEHVLGCSLFGVPAPRPLLSLWPFLECHVTSSLY